jgi:predicted lactoylglutathione lyase
MSKMIFVNLPVADLPKSSAFYEALGFTNNSAFSDETAACMVWSEAIYGMLLTHGKWKTFTDRPIPAASSSEVMLCVSCDDRNAVNVFVDAGAAKGGIADLHPPP